MVKFQPVIEIPSFECYDFKGARIGQWFKTKYQKGQFLGITKAGNVLIAYRCATVKRHAAQVKAMRKYALRYR